MEKYYALDYVDERECELIYDAQLYRTREEAAAARAQMSNPERFDISWYTYDEIQNDLFCGMPIVITDKLTIAWELEEEEEG